MAFDITTVAGKGTENLDSGSAMPFIRILQDMSPQLKKQKDEYIEGAESGDLFFNKNKTVVQQPAQIIPCFTQSVYTEWVPRSSGGGFVATHPLSVTTNSKYEKGRDRQYDEWLGENELRFTTYFFVLLNINDEWEQAVIPFTVSQLKIARKFTNDINRFRYEDDNLKGVVPPLFAQRWELGTTLETNKNGDDYYNFGISNSTPLDLEEDENLLALAAETYSSAVDTPLLQTAGTPQLVGPTTEVSPF